MSSRRERGKGKVGSISFSDAINYKEFKLWSRRAQSASSRAPRSCQAQVQCMPGSFPQLPLRGQEENCWLFLW